MVLMRYSGLSAYDNKGWIYKLVDYVKQVLAHDAVKIPGLCFGHQIVGRALGAEGAVNTLGYEISVCKVDLTPLGAKIFGKDRLVCTLVAATFIQKPLHQRHLIYSRRSLWHIPHTTGSGL